MIIKIFSIQKIICSKLKSKFTKPSTFTQATNKSLHYFDMKFLGSLKSFIYDIIYIILNIVQFEKSQVQVMELSFVGEYT